jgi:hypothetical protein
MNALPPSSPSPINNGIPNLDMITNTLIHLSFFAPFVLTLYVVLLGVLFQNTKGFIYLGFLLGASLLRELLLYLFNPQMFPKIISKSSNSTNICESVQYSQYGNNTFSCFIFAFTILYICVPMFIKNISINWFLVSTMLFFMFLDIGIKIYKGCIQNNVQMFIDILMGGGLASLITSLMVVGGSSAYLFFNETASNKEVCNIPKKQTFKCAVYKNGELVV